MKHEQGPQDRDVTLQKPQRPNLLREGLQRLRGLFLPSTGGLHIGDNMLDAEADSGGNIDPFWKRADATSANLSDPVSLGAAPNSVDYLVGQASGDLSAEIVVGTTPGGELGNTWPSPTVDSTHSGSAHHDQSHTVASHSDTTGTGAELNTLTDTSDADSLHGHTNHGVTHNAAHTLASHSAKAHADLSDAPADAHHAESHTITSHSDTTSGTYTPTLTNGTNVAASTAYESQFIRVGAIVNVGGKFDCDPTDADTQTILGISLPVASNFGTEQDCGGAVGCRTITGAGAVLANISGDRADAQFFPTGTGNAAWGFTFTYQII